MNAYIAQRRAQGATFRQAFKEWRRENPEPQIGVFRTIDGWLGRAIAWSQRLQGKQPPTA